jgi:hypothetical protein
MSLKSTFSQLNALAPVNKLYLIDYYKKQSNSLSQLPVCTANKKRLAS